MAYWWLPGRKGHTRWSTDLSVYLDGEVDPNEARRIEEHLASCQQCQEDLDQLRAVKVALQSLPQVSPRRSFVLTPTESVAHSHSRAGGGRWAQSYLAARLASAALAVVLFLLVGMDFLTTQQNAPTLSEVAEVAAPVREAPINRVGGQVAGTLPVPAVSPTIGLSIDRIFPDNTAGHGPTFTPTVARTGAGSVPAFPTVPIAPVRPGTSWSVPADIGPSAQPQTERQDSQTWLRLVEGLLAVTLLATLTTTLLLRRHMAAMR